MFRIYCLGVILLLAAIFLNAVILKLGIMGWYEFLGKLQAEGKKTFASMRPVDYAWLFLAYPLLLGLACHLGDKLYAFFFLR